MNAIAICSFPTAGQIKAWLTQILFTNDPETQEPILMRRKQTDTKISEHILCLAPKCILVLSRCHSRAAGRRLSHTNTVLPARTGRRGTDASSWHVSRHDCNPAQSDHQQGLSAEKTIWNVFKILACVLGRFFAFFMQKSKKENNDSNHENKVASVDWPSSWDMPRKTQRSPYGSHSVYFFWEPNKSIFSGNRTLLAGQN